MVSHGCYLVREPRQRIHHPGLEQPPMKEGRYHLQITLTGDNIAQAFAVLIEVRGILDPPSVIQFVEPR